MINFIICDDIEKYRTMIKRVIVKYMMKNKLEYKTHIFKDYDEEFLKNKKKKLSFKIYILDIEAPSMSGIDIARIIRKKDTDSVLIFLTGHQELTPVIMKNDFLFLSFINKFENCEMKEANDVCDYLLNGRCKYKISYESRIILVDGLCENGCVTPLRRPILLAKAIEIWLG